MEVTQYPAAPSPLQSRAWQANDRKGPQAGVRQQTRATSGGLASWSDGPVEEWWGGPHMLKIFFLVFMAGGLPVAIAMAGASLAYLAISGSSPPFVVIHRMIGGIDSFPLLAVPFFILAGNLMNNAGITTRIYNFALALVGWLKGGLGPCQRAGLGDLRRHERHRHRRCRGPGHDRDQGDEGAWLLDRVRGRRDRRLGHARADHPAQPAVRHLRDDGQRVGRRAVPGRHPAGGADGAC